MVWCDKCAWLYTSEEENMIKVADNNLATDLIEVLFDYDSA